MRSESVTTPCLGLGWAMSGKQNGSVSAGRPVTRPQPANANADAMQRDSSSSPKSWGDWLLLAGRASVAWKRKRKRRRKRKRDWAGARVSVSHTYYCALCLVLIQPRMWVLVLCIVQLVAFEFTLLKNNWKKLVCFFMWRIVDIVLHCWNSDEVVLE
jgi:hypothetical protein